AEFSCGPTGDGSANYLDGNGRGRHEVGRAAGGGSLRVAFASGKFRYRGGRGSGGRITGADIQQGKYLARSGRGRSRNPRRRYSRRDLQAAAILCRVAAGAEVSDAPGRARLFR